MNIHETLQTKKAEETFSAALVVVLLVILPQLGGTAMLVGSIVGLIAYMVLFRERLHNRGWWKAILLVVMAAAMGAILAILFGRHWY